MKRLISAVMTVSFILISFSGCLSTDTIDSSLSENSETETVSSVEDTVLISTEFTVAPMETEISVETELTELPESMQPSVYRIRSICQLATIRVYFHNVAKSTKDKGTGISSWLKTDRDFWVAYSGSVDVGIDMTKVEMTIVGNEITVSLPNPEIMGIVNIESEEEPICQPDHWYTRENVISSDDKSGAIATANSEMTSQISNDASIMMTARQRAEDLIRNYIEALAQYSNTDYHVTFVDL